MGKKTAKSLRTAFIRVSCTNNTEQGLVTYNLNDIVQICEEWQKKKTMKYYIKDHIGEEDDTHPHIHLVIKFGNPTPFDDIKKKFPYGSIESAKNIKKCVQYLVHMNDKSKTQFNFDDIITNDKNIGKFRIKDYENQLIELDDYIRMIDKGQIREHNLTDSIPIDIFTNHKTKLLNALEYYRRKVMTDKNRNINVMIFTGTTGTYKTTYAKQYAINSNKSICISSSSNDPMQDYKGEDILVLDDIRDDTFKFHDLLKVLDNHTNSSVQSRYNNKAFIGDTIIITSSLPISEWYFDNTKEDKDQLYRRVRTQMQFTKDEIKLFEYNDNARKYIYVATMPNINNIKVEEAPSKLLDIVKTMGVVVSEEVENQILNARIDSEYNGRSIGDVAESTFLDPNFSSKK